MRRLGRRVGVEAKHKAVQVVIGPNVNMHRDPRGGRNFETFSEDPLLAGQLAAEIVNGIQAEGVGACVKHFVGNESETKRRSYNVAESRDSRAIREIYMGAFQQLLRSSDPASIMMAYNQIDGVFCSQTPLIKDVLREAWNYDGCVMSDWYGTHSGPDALKAGLDLEMPGPSVFRGHRLVTDYNNGLVTMEDIDKAVTGVLTMIGKTARSHSSDAEKVVISKETSDMAREAATEGIVLVKNASGVLPLDVRRAPRIAVVGNAAIEPSVTGGGSACAHPQYIQRPLDCIRKAHPFPEMVGYAKGINPNHTVPTASMDMLATSHGERGVEAEYYNDGNEQAVFRETLDSPQVVMLGFVKPGLNRTGFRFVMKTTLTPKTSGLHTVAVQVTGAYELYVDDQLVSSGETPDISVEDFLFVPKKLEHTAKIQMDAGKPYSVRLRVHSRDQSPASGELSPNAAKICFEEEYSDDEAIAEAMNLAAKSDVSIIFGGRTHEHESEGFDLTTLKLPENQVRMIKSVAAVSRKTVLVLHGGNPIDVSDFVDAIDALLIAHFPGQEGAQAIADIINGVANPSGKLATSWPFRLDDDCVPSHSHFPATKTENGLEIKYAEGLEVGYRHTNAATMYRYPFGFGLSYTTFKYGDLRVVAEEAKDTPYADRTLTFSVSVSNDGPFPGHEVVQLYSLPPAVSDVWRPAKELKGFQKVFLMPGETKTVEVSALCRDIAGVWDADSKCWKSMKGPYGFTVDSCRVALYLREEETWTGL